MNEVKPYSCSCIVRPTTHFLTSLTEPFFHWYSCKGWYKAVHMITTITSITQQQLCFTVTLAAYLSTYYT